MEIDYFSYRGREELKYLIEYLEKNRRVGACMSKRMIDALQSFSAMVEEFADDEI